MCWPSPQAVQLCSQGSEKLEQILPIASGPAKEILLCKYAISGETNNLHPQRACVSFDEKADGTKAFVTATELVAASLQEESPLRISECRTGANPRSASRHAYGHFQFRPYGASVDPTEGEMKTEREKERGGGG